MSESPTRFAFGQNTTSQCSCPVITVGRSPEEARENGLLALRYDTRMEEMQDEAFGVASEEDAMEAWKGAIVDLDSKGEPDAADRGREIAEELGWSIDV